jgi:hypothetical protein
MSANSRAQERWKYGGIEDPLRFQTEGDHQGPAKGMTIRSI